MNNETPFLKRLQLARKEISETNFKKTGKVTYKGQTKFEYYELSDFLPTITQVCEKNNIIPVMGQMTTESATLTIFDALNSDDSISFSMPVKTCQLIGTNDMQNIGGTYSYAKRYLYMNAFEISENDMTEALTQGDEGDKPIGTVKLKVIKELLETTGVDELNFMNWLGITDLKEITERQLPRVMSVLEKKKEQIKK
jgi:ERF superfamily.